jgi:hypothetical protein
VDEVRISPAGDPFYGAAQHRSDPRCACIDGRIYIGHIVEGDDGAESEVVEAYPCRRCGGRED